MARNTIPSNPSDLITAPFVEATVSIAELNDLTDGTGGPRSRTMHFGELCIALRLFRKGVTVVTGSTGAFSSFMAKVLVGDDTGAEAIFKTGGGWTLTFPWCPIGRSALTSPPWRDVVRLYGERVAGSVYWALRGTAGYFYSEWLDSPTAARTTVSVSPVEASQNSGIVRITFLDQDLWFTEIEQGFRIHGVRQEIVDLSDSPLSADATSQLAGHSYFLGPTTMYPRIWSDKKTLAENLVYNRALQFISDKFSSLQTLKLDDPFFTHIRSNIPLGAYLGNSVATPDRFGFPRIILHDTPRESYNTLKRLLPDGAQLRQGGLLAAPSRAAVQTGTDASLELVGRKARVSRKMRKSRLYDRDTAESLGGALKLDDTLISGHSVFDDYQDWYRERRAVAAKIAARQAAQNGFAPPHWGKWGFNPWSFAGLQPHVRLFIKLVKEYDS